MNAQQENDALPTVTAASVPPGGIALCFYYLATNPYIGEKRAGRDAESFPAGSFMFKV